MGAPPGAGPASPAAAQASVARELLADLQREKVQLQVEAARRGLGHSDALNNARVEQILAQTQGINSRTMTDRELAAERLRTQKGQTTLFDTRSEILRSGEDRDAALHELETDRYRRETEARLESATAETRRRTMAGDLVGARIAGVEAENARAELMADLERERYSGESEARLGEIGSRTDYNEARTDALLSGEARAGELHGLEMERYGGETGLRADEIASRTDYNAGRLEALGSEQARRDAAHRAKLDQDARAAEMELKRSEADVRRLMLSGDVQGARVAGIKAESARDALLGELDIERMGHGVDRAKADTRRAQLLAEGAMSQVDRDAIAADIERERLAQLRAMGPYRLGKAGEDMDYAAARARAAREGRSLSGSGKGPQAVVSNQDIGVFRKLASDLMGGTFNPLTGRITGIDKGEQEQVLDLVGRAAQLMRAGNSARAAMGEPPLDPLVYWQEAVKEVRGGAPAARAAAPANDPLGLFTK